MRVACKLCQRLRFPFRALCEDDLWRISHTERYSRITTFITDRTVRKTFLDCDINKQNYGKGKTSPSSAKATELKKNIGRVIVKINSEVLDLIVEYRKIKHNGEFSDAGKNLEESVKKKKINLENTLAKLELRAEFIKQEKMEKFIKMVKTNIETAGRVLDIKDCENETLVEDVQNSSKEIKEILEEINQAEEDLVNEIDRLSANLSTMVDNEDITDEESIERELKHIGKYQADRYRKMIKDIEKKMKKHHEELKEKWEKDRDVIDHQALKDIRNEFELTHKKCRYMAAEWDKRKLSERLSDQIVDVIDSNYDEYMVSFQKMNEIKTTDVTRLRLKSTELEEYKKD